MPVRCDCKHLTSQSPAIDCVNKALHSSSWFSSSSSSSSSLDSGLRPLAVDLLAAWLYFLAVLLPPPCCWGFAVFREMIPPGEAMATGGTSWKAAPTGEMCDRFCITVVRSCGEGQGNKAGMIFWKCHGLSRTSPYVCFYMVPSIICKLVTLSSFSLLFLFSIPDMLLGGSMVSVHGPSLVKMKANTRVLPPPVYVQIIVWGKVLVKFIRRQLLLHLILETWKAKMYRMAESVYRRTEMDTTRY